MPCWQQQQRGAWSLSHANLAGLTCHRTIRYTREGPATTSTPLSATYIIITRTDGHCRLPHLHHGIHLLAVVNLEAKDSPGRWLLESSPSSFPDLAHSDNLSRLQIAFGRTRSVGASSMHFGGAHVDTINTKYLVSYGILCRPANCS